MTYTGLVIFTLLDMIVMGNEDTTMKVACNKPKDWQSYLTPTLGARSAKHQCLQGHAVRCDTAGADLTMRSP